MPRIGSTNNPPVDTNVVFVPRIENITIPLANTEISHAFPTKTKRFTIKNRTAGLIKLAYAVGTSGATYFSMEPGTTYDESEIGATNITLYLQSATAAQVLEIISWT